MYKTAGTPHLMKAMNRTMITDTLAKQGPISQTRICEITGLSRATVSTMIKELKSEQLVLEVSREISSGGRRQVLLALDASAGYVVGVDLGGTKMAGAVTDLSGKPLVKLRWPTKAEDGPEAVVETLIDFVEALIAKSGIDRAKLRGIGVGVPGIVKPRGIVQWAPTLRWRNIDLAARLAPALNHPVFVENDVNLLALGEYWYGAAQGAPSLVCLAVGTGIGAGIVLDGQLYTGAHQAAGEVSNMVVDRSFLARDFTQFGCLEAIASGPAIARQFASTVKTPRKDRTGDRQTKPGNGGTEAAEPAFTGAEIVFEEARRNNPHAKQIIEEFAQHLAMAIIALTTVIDPTVIVLGGGVSQNAGLFRERLLELCTPVVQVMPRLEISSLGVDAGVMGAIALTLHNTNENPLRQDLPLGQTGGNH